jgi:hypothetical protein
MKASDKSVMFAHSLSENRKTILLDEGALLTDLAVNPRRVITCKTPGRILSKVLKDTVCNDITH